MSEPHTLPFNEEKLQEDPDGFARYYWDDDAGIAYDVVTLWRLSEFLSTFNILAGDFGRFLERTLAWTDGAPINSKLEGEHWDRILEADLSYPILVRFKHGKMGMVDGYHRLMRAKVDGEPFIQARDVSAILEEARIE